MVHRSMVAILIQASRNDVEMMRHDGANDDKEGAANRDEDVQKQPTPPPPAEEEPTGSGAAQAHERLVA